MAGAWYEIDQVVEYPCVGYVWITPASSVEPSSSGQYVAGQPTIRTYLQGSTEINRKLKPVSTARHENS